MRKQWHYGFLVLALLVVLFPPVLWDHGDRIELLFAAIWNPHVPAMFRDWGTALGLELIFLSIFVVFALRKTA